jgi:hypothetical protein
VNALLIAYGVAIGVILMTFGVWLPSRAHWRRQLNDLREIHRIEGGYRLVGNPEATQPLLDDARGAFAAATAAYLPVYPGRREPEPAWLAWIREGGVEYTDGRTYLAAHASDLIATEPGPVHPAGFEQSVWGSDYFPTTTPTPRPVWDFAWAWHERLLVPLVLGLLWLDRPARYPWRQKLLDRVWETGVVFETSGARLNRRLLGGLDGALTALTVLSLALVLRLVWLVAGLVEAVATLVEFGAGPVDWVRRRATRRRTPNVRPKRYYPIKEA